MKKGSIVTILVVLTIFLVSSAFAVDSASSFVTGLDNLARVVDLNNDGQKDFLAFADKIDTRASPIELYLQNDGVFPSSPTVLDSRNLDRCSLSYNDYNNDTFLDIYYTCFDSGDNLVSNLLTYNGSSYSNSSFSNLTTQTLSSNSYGDTVFLDFNNDNLGDILSCFHGTNSLTFFQSNGTNFTQKDSGISTSTYISDSEFTNCFLLPLDFDADGDVDIITYTYDANSYSLYNNTFCDLTSCSDKAVPFTLVTAENATNQAFFADKKIKHLQAFDSNQDGFSDLYYIVDTNNGSGSTRNISFGYQLNNKLNQDFTPSISTPEIKSVRYIRNTTTYVNFSWENYSENYDYIEILLNTSIYNISSRTDLSATSYNLNISSSDTVIGDYFVSNYDLHAGYGNMLKRDRINLSLAPQCYNYSSQAIAPSKLKSLVSAPTGYPIEVTVNQSTFPIEFCDGYDNDCDGLVDENSVFYFPDGSNVTINFNQDGDNNPYTNNPSVPRYSTFTSGGYSVTFSCVPLKDNFFSNTPDNEFYDPDDEDSSIKCGKNVRQCDSSIVNQDTSSSSGGRSSSSFISLDSGTEGADDTTEEPEGNDNSDTTNVSPPESNNQGSSDDDSSYSETKTINKLIESLTANSLRHTQTIQYTRGSTIVQEQIRNIGLFPQDFKLVITVPKEITELATNINSRTEFDIIEMDPVIQFSAEDIQSYDSFVVQYTFPNNVPEELLNQITHDIIPENPDEQDYAQIEKQINDTKEALNITQRVETKDNQTIYTIDLNLDDQAKLTNVSIYQEIPKCLLEIINEHVAESDVNFEVVEADPLIVWHFDELLNTQKIQLAINAVADEACTDQAITVALAKQIVYSQSEIDYQNVAFALLFIPLIAVLLILADIFTRHEKHEKKEINTLVHYIKTHLHKGIPLWEIKQHLLNKGHHVDDVEEACNLNSNNTLHKHFLHFNISIHEFLLVFLIIINILDFAEFLPGDIDYFKKILSWVILGYLLHRISITSLLLGKKFPHIDLLLIFSFFALTLKNLVGFAKTAIDEVHLVQDLYAFIWRHNQVFEVYFFLAGLAGIMLATILISREEARAPSLINSIVKHQNYIKRFIFTHALLLIFFISVFNLMFEWLAIAVDAFILITTIAIVIFLAIKHHKRFRPAELVEEIAEDAEKLYEKVLNLFHYTKYLPLAFSAMLILYVLTEIANYLIPYLTGIYDIIYFGNFGRSHMPLFSIEHFLDPAKSLFASQIQNLATLDISFVLIAYVFNIIAMVYLLTLPARYWWNHYVQKEKPIVEKTHFLLNPVELSLFVASLVVFFTRPIFTITTLRTYDLIGGENTLVGVDILTQPILLQNLHIVLLFALGSAIVAFVLEKIWKKPTSDIILLFSFGFFTYYVYLFFLTQKDYYLETIATLLFTQPVIAVYLTLFAAFTFFFIYILGYLMVAYLYMPSGLQHVLFTFPVLKTMLKHQHLHHIEHVNHSNDKVKSVEDYVKKSLASDHELFRIVEHLEEKGYDLDFIESIIHDVVPDKKLIEGFDHFKHYHHNKEILHALHRYIKQEYKKRDLKDIIDEVLSRTFTVKDAVAGLQRLHTLHHSNGELRMELAKDPLKVKQVLKKHPSPESTIIATLKTFDTIPADELTIHVVHRLHRKYHNVNDIITHTEKFRFGEEDIRIALKHIAAKNDFDEEIMKYV